jgi:hypothetical protein
MTRERNRQRFPTTAELVDALRAAGYECSVLHAREGRQEAGAPLQGVEWAPTVASRVGGYAGAADRSGPALDQATLSEIARAEANRYRAMKPKARGRYLRFVGTTWWAHLTPERRAQVEALEIER